MYAFFWFDIYILVQAISTSGRGYLLLFSRHTPDAIITLTQMKQTALSFQIHFVSTM